MMLEWHQEQPDVWVAYSDQLRVGHVLRRIDNSIYFDATVAVHMRHIAKKPYFGEIDDFEAGKRAVEKAWSTWCQQAGLTQVSR